MPERLNSTGGLVPQPERAPLRVEAGDWSEDRPVRAEPLSSEQWLDGGLALLDTTGAILQINEVLAAWFDGAPEALVGKNIWSLLAERCPAVASKFTSLAHVPSFQSLHFAATIHGQTEGNPPFLRLETTSHQGTVFLRLDSALPGPAEMAEGGREFPALELVQRQLVARLSRAEAQLKLLSEQWPGVIFSQRADYSFRFVSPQIEELTGVPAAEWQRRPELFWQAVHEADATELKAQLARARISREPLTLTYRLRHFHTGRIVYVMEHRRLTLSPGGLWLGSEGVWLDVTRQTLAERRLSSAAWKETLSVLTMSLAHDFGNEMAGIHALAETFLDNATGNDEFVDGLNLMKRNTRQASQLVHRIINLHQSQPGECYYHNLNEIADDLAKLIRKILPRRMQFTLELAPSSLPAYLDAVELRQVVMNLVLNAVDAMPPDGHLVVQTASHSQLPSVTRHLGALARWPAVGLSVRDNGAGIAPSNLGRIFEPFFTTKAATRESGLGLYNARLFVERHRGLIAFAGLPGGGTSFSLLFPEADFAEADAAAPSKT